MADLLLFFWESLVVCLVCLGGSCHALSEVLLLSLDLLVLLLLPDLLLPLLLLDLLLLLLLLNLCFFLWLVSAWLSEPRFRVLFEPGSVPSEKGR